LKALEEASVNFRRIEGFLTRATEILGAEIEPKLSAEFAHAMNDDLSSTCWFGSNFRRSSLRRSCVIRERQNCAGTSRIPCSLVPYKYLVAILTIYIATSTGASTEVIDGLIALALEQREAARARKDFSTSDSIRDHISGLGITLEDTPSGPRWSIDTQGK
jgi:cysteinyl-tRNA synthetase